MEDEINFIQDLNQWSTLDSQAETVNMSVLVESSGRTFVLELLAAAADGSRCRHDVEHSHTPDKKSLEVSVKIQDQKPLYLFAQYKELNSLEEVAAWEISRNLRSPEHLQKLVLNADIPSTLMSEVKRFL